MYAERRPRLLARLYLDVTAVGERELLNDEEPEPKAVLPPAPAGAAPEGVEERLAHRRRDDSLVVNGETDVALRPADGHIDRSIGSSRAGSRWRRGSEMICSIRPESHSP